MKTCASCEGTGKTLVRLDRTWWQVLFSRPIYARERCKECSGSGQILTKADEAENRRRTEVAESERRRSADEALKEQRRLQEEAEEEQKRRADPNANIDRWQSSNEPGRLVNEMCGVWSKGDFETLLWKLKRTEYWPLDPDAVKAVLEQRRLEWMKDPANEALSYVVGRAYIQDHSSFGRAVERLRVLPNGAGVTRLIEAFQLRPWQKLDLVPQPWVDRHWLGLALVIVGRKDVVVAELDQEDPNQSSNLYDVAYTLEAAGDPDCVRFALDYAESARNKKNGDVVKELLKRTLEKHLDKIDDSLLRRLTSLPSSLVHEVAPVSEEPYEKVTDLSDIHYLVKKEMIRRGTETKGVV